MFNNLIRKYYALDDVELNLGSGGDSIGVDKIGAVSYEVIKQAFGSPGSLTLVDAGNPLPVTDAVAEAALASLAAEDFATQTTLAAILAKIIAAPATEATLASILAKIIAAPSTEAKQDVIITALNAIDAGTAAALGQAAMAASVPVVIASNQSAVPISGTVTVDTSLLATQATLAAILAKIIAAPATEAKQDSEITQLTTLNAKDFATQTTLAAILAKIIAAPATEAKQDTGNTSLATIAAKDFATQTTLAAILAKIIAAPATEAKQDTQITALGTLATQATVAAILAKIIAAPATEAKQDTQITAEQAAATSLAIMDDWDESDRAKVNLIAGQVGISGGTGTDGATVPRVTLATNVGLPAGTSLLGIVQTKDLPDAASTYALTNVTSTAYEASHVLKASAGYLFMVTGYNSRTSSQFIQLFNSTTVPADTAVPVIIFRVPASSNFSLDLGKYGRYFSTGIAISNSSTGPTKTVGTTDTWYDAQII